MKLLNIALSTAYESLKRNKVRTSMTLFGIAIGIAMVIIVLSAGAGVQSLVLSEVNSFGNNWINIEVKVPSTGRNSRENAQALAGGVSITSLTLDDAEAIGELDTITDFYAGVTSQFVTTYRAERQQPTVFAVTPGYFRIDTAELAAGRVFTEAEENSASQVAVLGSTIAEDLFGNDDPVGKRIKVDSRLFEVIGVLAERGSTGFFSFDDILFLPLQTTQRKLMGIEHILFIIAQTADNSQAEDTAEEIRFLLRSRHDITDAEQDDFAVTTQAESIEIVSTVLDGVTWLLVALAAISLLVGGVGIMNVMYVSVAERTFEIGLRKALGASQKNIRAQFLTEAVLITLFGGVVGMAVGALLSLLIAVVAQSQGFDWPFSLSLFSLFLGTGFSAMVGLIFGTAPANAAATLDPIVAMRVE